MDGEEAGSEGEGAAEEQEKTESGEVNYVWQATCDFYVLNNHVEQPRAVVFLRATFYCMDEKELVEAAVSFLTRRAGGHAARLTDHKVALFALSVSPLFWQ